MAGQDGELAQLAETVLGLMQAVSGMAAEQWQQGQMLRALLELTAEKPKGEMRLDELIRALIGRLDAHAGAIAHVEGEFKKITTVIADAIGNIAVTTNSNRCSSHSDRHTGKFG